MKRILRIGSVIGGLAVTGLLIYLLVINFSDGSFGFPKVEFQIYPKVEFKVYPKVESSDFAKAESPDFAKIESPDYPKVESGEPKSNQAGSYDPNCDPFGGMDLSLGFLALREEIMVLPVILRTDGDVIPGLVPPDDTQPVEYYALLGDYESNACELQGYEDMLFCMFTVPQNIPGSVVDFYLYKKGCENPTVTQLNLTIPIPVSQPVEKEKVQCKKDLSPNKCRAAGGEMSTSVTTAPVCVCP